MDPIFYENMKPSSRRRNLSEILSFSWSQTARAASNLQRKSEGLAIARYRYRQPGRVNRVWSIVVVWGMVVESLCFTQGGVERATTSAVAKLPGRWPMQRHRQSHERTRLGPSTSRSWKGPKTKAEPSFGGFPPFMPAFRFFALFWTIATTGTGSSTRDPVANRSVSFCVAAKIRRVPSPLRFGSTQ